MHSSWQSKSTSWLLLSLLVPIALVGCPGPTAPEASFTVTGQALGDSFVDGSEIQPLEATVTNTSDNAGTPPDVTFIITTDLEYLSLDSALYACDTVSETALLCKARDGAKIEARAKVSLKPVFDVTAKLRAPTPAGVAPRVRPQGTGLIELNLGIGSPILAAPITFTPRSVTASATGFDLSIAKTVSQPFVVGGNGGTGEFTLNANVTGSPLPSYVKIQDPPLPTGFSYDLIKIATDNPNWTCNKNAWFGAGYAWAAGLGLSCKLKAAFVSITPYPALKVSVKMLSSVTTTTQQNCPYVYPLLGDSNQNNNHLEPAPYTTPCTPYTPLKTDLAITKTQIAPLSNPAGSFYWGLPGAYQIVVRNTTNQPTGGPITFTDVLSNIPTGTTIAFSTDQSDVFPASAGWTILDEQIGASNSNGWRCLGVYPSITCTYSGVIPANASAPALVLGVQVKPQSNTLLANGETNCAALPSDADNTNNQSCVSSQNEAIESFNLKITKTHTGSSFAPGSAVNYSLLVENVGGSDAPGPVVVKDTLPAVFVSATAPTVTPAGAATCTVVFPAITCTSTGAVPLNTGFTVSFSATTSSTAAAQTVTNVASVSSKYDAFDLNPANNTSSDTLALSSPLNLFRANSVVQASNGDFIVVGSAETAAMGRLFTVRRYASDGTTVLWTKTTDFSGDFRDDDALDVALDTSNPQNIIVVGRADLGAVYSDTRAVIVKYDAAGVIASGFPAFTGTTADDSYDYFSSVAVDASNRIITGGLDGLSTVSDANVGFTDSKWVLHRFSSTGVADTAFNTTGRVVTNAAAVLGYSSSYGSAINDVIVDETPADATQYRIYAGGRAPTGGSQKDYATMAIGRYTNSGTLDTTWGGAGIVQTFINDGKVSNTMLQNSVVYGIGIQTVGGIRSIVAAGTGCGSSYCPAGVQPARSCVVTRYAISNGALDTSFGQTGNFGASSFGAADATSGKNCFGVSVNASGGIAISGFSNGADLDYLALKLDATGALVTAYGGDNPNAYPALARADRSSALTWTSAGTLMTVGWSYKDATENDEWVVKIYP